MHHHSHGWTLFGAGGSLLAGIASALAKVPAGVCLGVLGSVAVPIVVELIRSWTHRRIAEIQAANDREKADLRAQNHALFDRLAHALADKDAR